MAEQTLNNNAAAVVGEVQSVSGRVVATGADGVERQLFAGDMVYADDLIKTIGEASAVIAMKDGSRLDLGSNTEASLDESVYSDDVDAARAAALADVKEIQAAIAAGADPTEITEPPAAGDQPAPTSALGESAQSALSVDRTGRVGLVQAGYETTGLEQNFEQLLVDPIPLLVEGDDGGAGGGTTGPSGPSAILVLAPITGDNIISAAEAGTTVAITGTVGGDVADGDIVTINVNGTDYTGPVSGGAFSISVPGSELLADADGIVDASVTTSTGDPAGEATAMDSQPFTVDTTPPTAAITLDPITADNLIDAAEAGGTVAITGTVGGDVADGDTVTLTINGIDYTGTVSGGTFSIDVPGSALVNDPDTTVEAGVTTSTGDVNGEATATASQPYTVDTNLPTATINIDPITADNVLNAAEAGGTVAVTGTVGGDVADGDTVTLTIDGTDFTGAVSGGAFSIDVPGSALASDSDLTVDASVTTSTGNANGEATATDAQTYAVDTTPPVATIALDPITADNVLNAAEAGGTVAITGVVGGDVADGDTVTLTIDGVDYTGTVSGGAFSIDVPGSALANDPDLTVDASVTTSTGDVNGEATATTTQTYTVDTTPPTATITLDPVTADNILSAAEVGGTVALTGTVGGDVVDGDTVTLTVGGVDYTGAVSGGTFSIDVPGSALAGDPDLTVDASVTTSTGDVNGEATATDTQTYTVDTGLPTASINLDPITPDNILNAAEAGGTVAVTGTVGGDVADGDIVTLTIGGADYTGPVSGGTFSIDVPGSALAADADSTVDASVTTSTGNVNGEATATDTQTYSVDTTAPTASIALDPITADNVLSAAEVGGTVPVTGTAGGDVADGDTVTLTIDGVDYTGTVSGGAFSIDVPGSALASDPDLTVDASVTTSTGDVNGEATATTTQTYTVDTTPPTASIALDPVAADDVLNAAEAGATVAITGTVGGDVTDGDIVTITVNGIDYMGAVAGGVFSIDVPGSALAADPDTTVDASVTTSTGDANGEATATTSRPYSVDTAAPSAPTVVITEDADNDGIIDSSELSGDIDVEIGLPGDAVAGDTLTVSDGSNTTTIVLTAADIAAGAVATTFPSPGDGNTISVTATLTDAAGNTSGPASDAATLDLTPIGVPPVAVDDPAAAPYSVALGKLGTSWTAIDSTGQQTTIVARDADGSPGTLFQQGNNLGVAGTPRTVLETVPQQIEFDRTTGQSESITLEFAGNMNQARFGVERLFANEDGGEQGRWVALYDGHEVARGTFVLSTGNIGTFNINTGALVFNEVRFESIDTVNRTGDGSDYFLAGFSGSGPASANTEYTLSADQTLTITAASPNDLLDNDSDPDGDPLTLIEVNGNAVTDGQTVTLSSGALLTISDDGSFVYDPNGQFDSLGAGEVATDSFTYTISDGNGGTDTATAVVTNIGVDAAATAATSLLVSAALPTVDGGVGDNVLTGSSGADEFYWNDGYQGTAGSPAVDQVTNFSLAEGDVLNLQDLLSGEAGGDLTDYLHFEQSGSDGVVHVSSNGGFSAGYSAGSEDQTIVLQNVDLSVLGSNDQQIIDSLLTSNNLQTD